MVRKALARCAAVISVMLVVGIYALCGDRRSGELPGSYMLGDWAAFLPVAILAAGIAPFLVLAWRCHCPHCKRWLNYRMNWGGRFCPYCGAKIWREP